MKFVPIFVDSSASKGLYAVHWQSDEFNVLDQCLKNWNDLNFVEDFLKQPQNRKDLQGPKYAQNQGLNTPEKVALQIKNQANLLPELLERLTEHGFDTDNEWVYGSRTLEQYDSGTLEELLIWKVKNKKAKPFPLLRFYVIKQQPNSHVIASGAIKVSHSMDRPHLRAALERARNTAKHLGTDNLLDN